MIKSNELRLGNLVELNTNGKKIIGLVYELKKESLLVSPSDELAPIWSEYNKLQPIPLTPEILEKCWFEKEGLEDPIWEMEISSFPIVRFYGKKLGILLNDRMLYIETLHQLQNIYFAVDGEELKIDISSIRSS